MSVKCSKCGKPAVYLRRYTAERLCKACLTSTTLQRVRRTINREKMLREDDRIAVAVSGGKDSAVLLDVLFRIEQDFPSVELVPITQERSQDRSFFIPPAQAERLYGAHPLW